MKKMRKEYKLLIGLGIVFVIVLAIILLKEDYIGKFIDKQKEKELISCHNLSYTKGIKYTDYRCIISDEVGNSYPLSYIQIESKSADIKALNKVLKENYNKAYNNVEYTKIDKNIQLENYESIEYKIYYYNGIVSLLIKEQNYKSNIKNEKEEYIVYNIDTNTHNVLENDEMKEKLNITRDTSSEIRAEVIKMYATKYRYDYNNEAPIYRNDSIDESVKSITYSNIYDVYIDDQGNSNFILQLYSPSKGEEVPYKFKIDKNGKISYEQE